MRKTNILSFFRQHPDFAKLQFSSILGNFASWGSFVALLVLLGDITDNGLQLGFLWALSGLAPLFFGLIAGVFIDRFNFKKGLVYTDSLRSVLSLGFIFIPLLEGGFAWIAYFSLRFVSSLCGSYSFAARQTIIPKIIVHSDLTKANGINFTIINIMRLLGLTMGGILIGLGGLNFVWIIQSVTYIISAIFISRMKVSTEPIQIKTKNFIEDFKYGFRESFRNKWVRFIFIMALSGGLVAGTFHLMLQQFVENIYHTSSYSLSLMYFVEGIVAVIVGYWIVKVNFQLKNIWMYGYLYVLNALSWILFGFNTKYILGLVLLTTFSITLSLTIPFERWIAQTKVPEEIRGRTFNLWNTISTMMLQLSGLIAGLIIDGVGLKYVPIIIGSFHLVIGLFVVFYLYNLSTNKYLKKEVI